MVKYVTTKYIYVMVSLLRIMKVFEHNLVVIIANLFSIYFAN